jgi:hypothetical protein
VDAILSETIQDPIGPDFMASPARNDAGLVGRVEFFNIVTDVNLTQKEMEALVAFRRRL